MKKFSIICGLALAMLTAGCSKDATTDLNPTVKTSLSVSLDQTRTYLDGVNILWSEGDKVAINGKEAAIPAAAVGTAGATFEGVAVAEDYSVFYPAELLDANFSGNNTYTIPVVQGYTEGSFAPDTSILVGYAEHNETKTSVALNNVYGYLKIVLTGAADVSKVYVSATAGEAISGTFTVDYKSAAVTPLAGESIIRIMGVEPADGVAEIVVAVPAGEYAQGFTVKAIDTTGKAMTKTIGKAGIEVERAQLYVLATIPYVGVEQSVVSVSNATELVAVMEQATAEFTGTVVLESDIDMTDVTITPVAEFNGTFDGQGYALKNWTSSEGLFTLNNGTIKNLTIDESCVLTLPEITENALIGFVTDSNTGLVSGCVNNADITLTRESDLGVQYKAGAIVGYSSGAGLVSNCTNNGDITITIPNITGSSDYFGGVVGNTSMSAAANIAVENCINNGDITVTVEGTSKNMYLGGISGACNSKGVINNCINNGTVTYNYVVGGTGAYANQGGIVGYTACTINDCKNYGNVNLNVGEAQTTRPAVAGIAGYVSKNVQGCSNYGKISVTGNKFGKAASATASGSGGEQWPVFGGCFGCVGNVASGGTADISDCNNYGDVVVVNPYGTCRFGVAGVVGEPCGNVTNCHNYGKVDATGGSQVFLGGVVGIHYFATDKVMSNCSNEGNIILREGSYFYGETPTADPSGAGYQYVGGLVGGYQTYTRVAVNNCENRGEVKSICRLPVRLGGLFGTLRGTVTECVNYGNVVNENGYGSKISAIGGLCGLAGGNSVDCENYGNVSLTNATGIYAASAMLGEVGGTQQTHTGTILKCTVTSNLNIALIVGGQNNNTKATTLGTEESPIVLKGVTLNGSAVTAENLASTAVATNTEDANIANLVYELGTTIVVE